MPARVFIGIGSNIDPATNVLLALTFLAKRINLTGLSTIYQTLPIGRPEQDPYYNGVCMATTTLPPLALHQTVLRNIEVQVGRRRTADRFAPRCIDLDLLLYDQQVLSQDGLQLPSPDVVERAFVCLPLLELDSALAMPDSGIQLAAIAGQLDSSGMTPLHAYTNQLKEALSL